MEVGIEQVIAAARELGIDAKLAEAPSLALGSSEVNLLDLTGAYASVRAGIAPVEPWGIVSFHADGQPRAFRVGPPKQATIDLRAYQPDLIGLLRLVVERGTGREADLGASAVGKTGTSQNHRDAWFVGFMEPLVVGVWVGNDDETPMNKVTGGKLPAQDMAEFHERRPGRAGRGSNGQRARCHGGQFGSRRQGRSCRLQFSGLRARLSLVPSRRLYISALSRAT